MRYPANGPVTSPYGVRIHPLTRRRSMHHGTDQGWGNGGGTRIFAPMSGEVVSYRYAGGYGNQLTIRNGNITITLAHLANAHVRSGWVSEGQHIATMGNTGTSAGTHVHTEAFVSGVRVDFETLLGGTAGNNSTPIDLEENELNDLEKKQLADIHAWLNDAANPNLNRIKAQNDITHAWLKGTVAPTLEKLLAFDIAQNQKLGTILEQGTTAVVDVEALADALAGKLGTGVTREQVVEIVNGARLVVDAA